MKLDTWNLVRTLAQLVQVFVGADGTDTLPDHGPSWKNAFHAAELIIHNKYQVDQNSVLMTEVLARIYHSRVV